MKIILSFISIFLLQLQLIYAQDEQAELLSFEPSECMDEYNIYSINNRITSLEHKNDTISVSISVRANCCISLKPDMKVHQDTIDLIFDHFEPEITIRNGDTLIQVEEECECDCCFSFKYKISGLYSENYVFRTMGKVIELSEHKYKVIRESQFEVLEGDTVNYIDIYGMKQGLHRYFDKEGREIRSLEFIDNNAVFGLMRREFSEIGTVARELYMLADDKYKFVVFDENGNNVKEGVTSDFLDEPEFYRK